MDDNEIEMILLIIEDSFKVFDLMLEMLELEGGGIFVPPFRIELEPN